MCLAIPSKIVAVEKDTATAQSGSVRRKVNLLLLEDIKVGDWVLVHAGFAIQVLDESNALESLSLIRETLKRKEDL